MSKGMKSIDLRKLATNFEKEKSKEELYWQRNDAKFRAVHQRCTNYDEFRQIVQAAHLRPLDRNETLTLERQSIAWNQPATHQSSSVLETVKPSESISDHSLTFVTPRNFDEFNQQWRRLPNAMKLDYLHRLSHLEQIFRSDIPTNFLQELSFLYQGNSSVENAEIIVDVLSNLPKSKRFELSKTFLNVRDKFELHLLFSRLCSIVHLRYSVFLLQTIYLEN